MVRTYTLSPHERGQIKALSTTDYTVKRIIDVSSERSSMLNDREKKTTLPTASNSTIIISEVVDQDVINDLYLSILESAKVPFTKEVPHNSREGVLSERNLKVSKNNSEFKHYFLKTTFKQMTFATNKLKMCEELLFY
uniref:Uncharacterized protein n=1 Tax=Heterorhabditis bacteriophora TaxID=37862 RepID=A0A1I7WQY2_HETBA